MDQRDLAGKVGQEQRLFHSRIAAADDDNFHAAIKEPVAGGAGRYTEPLEPLFGRQAQPFGPGPGGKDYSISGIGCPGIANRHERTGFQIQRGDDVADDLGPHGAGVSLHPDHQVGALHLGIAGPVFNFGGRGQLTTRFDPLHEHRLQHGAGRIDGGGISGGTGTDDQDRRMTGLGHGCSLLQGNAIAYSGLCPGLKPTAAQCRHARTMVKDIARIRNNIAQDAGFA